GLLHGQHAARQRQPRGHRLHPQQGGGRGRRARVPDRRRHARPRGQGAGGAARAGRGGLRGVFRRRQVRDERRALPPRDGIHPALRRAGDQPRRGPHAVARRLHARGGRCPMVAHARHPGGGRGRDGGTRHRAGRAHGRPRPHRASLDRRGRPARARREGARGARDRGGHAPPPAAHRGRRARVGREHEDGPAPAENAEHGSGDRGARRRHDRLRGHRPRAARGEREGRRVRPGRQRRRGARDGGHAAARPPREAGAALRRHAGVASVARAGAAAAAARRQPGGRGPGGSHADRSRRRRDDRSGALQIQEPQYAVRGLDGDGPALQDDRRGNGRMASVTDTAALLVLRDGRVFRGRALGATGETSGEVIFNTAMTGYQEILTDPSYRGQIVTMTYPMIGNYGINEEDVESHRPWANGLIVKEASACPSSWRGRVSLDDYLKAHDLVGLQAIDTRALTRHLRDAGAQDGLVSSVDLDVARLREKARALPGLVGRDLVAEVTAAEPFTWKTGAWDLAKGYPPAPSARFNVVAFDAGIKFNILRQLRTAGCAVTVVPASTPAEAVLEYRPGGVF